MYKATHQTSTTFLLIVVLGLCLACIFLPTGRAYAQEATGIKGILRIPDASHVQILTTIDGTTLMGRIVEIGQTEIQFEADVGTLTISITKIKEIKEVPISLIKKGVYWFPNPNHTRLFFAPTARQLKRGEGYFADYYLFFPMVAYGITDNITIAGGVSIFPWIGIENQLIYFTPKVGFNTGDNFALSAGALMVRLISFDNGDSPTVGILYGVGTLGGSDSNITAGLGYGFVDWELADKPLLMLGGQSRLSRRMSFVTENWMLPGMDGPLISYGFRFFGETMSIDLGFINVITDGALFPGIPYIDFVVKL